MTVLWNGTTVSTIFYAINDDHHTVYEPAQSRCESICHNSNLTFWTLQTDSIIDLHPLLLPYEETLHSYRFCHSHECSQLLWLFLKIWPEHFYQNTSEKLHHTPSRWTETDQEMSWECPKAWGSQACENRETDYGWYCWGASGLVEELSDWDTKSRASISKHIYIISLNHRADNTE